MALFFPLGILSTILEVLREKSCSNSKDSVSKKKKLEEAKIISVQMSLALLQTTYLFI